MTRMIGQLHVDGRGYQVEAKAGGTAEIFLYDEIGEWGITARQFAKDLKEIGPVTTLVVRINSVGGSVFDSLAIYNLLKAHEARVEVHVDGLAASGASVVAMAGDEIIVAENAFIVIHDPLWCKCGDASELREMAEVLDKLKVSIRDTYVARTGLDAEKVEALMAEETWLNAAEAVELGFADRVDEALKVAASIDPKRLRDFARIPESFQPTSKPTEVPAMAATYQELKAAIPEADPAFLCAQLDAGADVDAARAAFQKHQVDQAKAEAAEAKAAAETQVAEAKAEAEKAKAAAEAAEKKAAALANAPGVDPVESGKAGEPGETEDEPVAAFDAAVREKIKAGMERQKAVMNVAQRQPDLYHAYLKATNPKRKARRLLDEKFDD